MPHLTGPKALEAWCKRITSGYPNVTITNMTSSWRNGLGFCAIIHHHCPQLIDYSNLQPENIFENNSLAFQVAENHLGIPLLLDPKDMVECQVLDKLSLLTYLAQYYRALHNPSEIQRRLRNAKLSQSFTVGRDDSVDTDNIEDTEDDTNINTPDKKLPANLLNRSILSLHTRGHGAGVRGDDCGGQGVVGVSQKSYYEPEHELLTGPVVLQSFKNSQESSEAEAVFKTSVNSIDVKQKESESNNASSEKIDGEIHVKESSYSLKYGLDALDQDIFDLDMKIMDIKIAGLEKQVIETEKKIRESTKFLNLDSEDDYHVDPNEEEELVQLFNLVNAKNDLVRKQLERMFFEREKILRAQQTKCEEEVRTLLEKSAYKTESDELEEARLINKIVEIVRERNEIVNHLELERIREVEEDGALEVIQSKLSQELQSKEDKPEKMAKRKRLMGLTIRKK